VLPCSGSVKVNGGAYCRVTEHPGHRAHYHLFSYLSANGRPGLPPTSSKSYRLPAWRVPVELGICSRRSSNSGAHLFLDLRHQLLACVAMVSIGLPWPNGFFLSSSAASSWGCLLFIYGLLNRSGTTPSGILSSANASAHVPFLMHFGAVNQFSSASPCTAVLLARPHLDLLPLHPQAHPQLACSPGHRGFKIISLAARKSTSADSDNFPLDCLE
jgi:hypothetical protein